MIQTNIQQLQDRIAQACLRAGRQVSEIKLVAVSKFFPAETIRDAYQLGLRIFGESRAQEFRDKKLVLPEDIEWHFIGPLQVNKIKYVAGRCSLIHSVDTLHLAGRLSDFAVKNGFQVPVLIEINSSAEPTKHGFDLADFEQSAAGLPELPGLDIRGLMTIGPNTEDQIEIRRAFSAMYELRERWQKRFGAGKRLLLSMGMTDDFEIAINEGTDIIRVGRAIFGERGTN